MSGLENIQLVSYEGESFNNEFATKVKNTVHKAQDLRINQIIVIGRAKDVNGDIAKRGVIVDNKSHHVKEYTCGLVRGNYNLYKKRFTSLMDKAEKLLKGLLKKAV